MQIFVVISWCLKHYVQGADHVPQLFEISKNKAHQKSKGEVRENGTCALISHVSDGAVLAEGCAPNSSSAHAIPKTDVSW
jgi:hypothetical protein